MRIARIDISNYRGLEQFSWTPGQENLLLGENNSGKSSILAALNLALTPASARTAGLTDFDFFRREMRPTTVGPGRRIAVTVTLSHLTDEEQRRFIEYLEPLDPQTGIALEQAETPAVIDAAGDWLGFRLEFQAWYDTTERELTTRHVFPKFGTDGPEVRTAQPADLRSVGYFMIPSFRDVDRAFTLARNSPFDNLLRASGVDLEGPLADVASLIEDAPGRLLDDAAVSARLKDVADAIDRFLPLAEDPKERMFFSAPFATGREVLQAVHGTIKPATAELPLPISRHGLGTRQLVLFAVFRELARLKGTSILALEEPEVGLHPNLQRLVLSELRRGLGADRPLQLICTTHSPVVAAQSPAGSIFVMRAGAKSPLPLEPPPPPSSTANVDNLHRTWCRKFAEHPGEILESVFAAAVLLVEGKSDVTAVPLLLRRAAAHGAPGNQARDLDGLGIAVVAATSGKADLVKLIHLYKRHYMKPVCVLVDSEKSTADVDQAVRDAQPDLLLRLPQGWAIERVILEAASASTLQSIANVAGAGDGQLPTDTAALREYVSHRVKKESLHRLASSLVPAEDLSSPVHTLLGTLASWRAGNLAESEIQLTS